MGSRNPRQEISVMATYTDRTAIIPGSPNSQQFLVASVSKTLFSAITLRLAAQGLLKLEEAVAHYVPPELISGLVEIDGVDFSEEISVLDLLSHQSGIPDYYREKRLAYQKTLTEVTAQDPGWTRDEAISLARAMTAEFAPNSGRTAYSFTNYQVLGAVLENVTGKELGPLLEKELTSPLGMNDTFLLEPSNSAVFDDLQPVYFGRHLYRGARRMASLGAEGAVVSSLSDLTRFVRALHSGEVIKRECFGEMMTMRGVLTRGVQYGLGVMAIDLPRFLAPLTELPRIYGHLGATGSFMLWTEDNSSTLVGTTNQFKGSGQRLALIRAWLIDVQKSSRRERSHQ